VSRVDPEPSGRTCHAEGGGFGVDGKRVT